MVYRYILLHNDRDWVNLQTELAFINAYFHLLQTRYGEGVQLNIAVSDAQCRIVVAAVNAAIVGRECDKA